ncbi:hypothetical protein [Wenjunlia tyrosinilytica]|uniref:Uncharacterized protein n=1 Tax=Wenjunlia tyrosinilytica TaxID=1544741 RepID=A0A918E112_9ACTN|nr:hypothetical protein [Wenjunlia tyrosinilytica]GGO94896.1 hypothetical protein GCM10012280_50860 [Wenjunlia tyrosinilytica]
MGMTPARRINVEIGELVLDGFGNVDHDLVADAFRRELTRLVTERGVSAPADLAVDVVRRALPPLPPTASPRRLGTALARAVHSGLERGSP